MIHIITTIKIIDMEKISIVLTQFNKWILSFVVKTHYITPLSNNNMIKNMNYTHCYTELKGFDISDIEKDILNDEVLKLAEQLGGNGTYPNKDFKVLMKDFKVLMKDYTVVTIV